MNPLGHLKTITRHHNLVCAYCFRAGLIRQGRNKHHFEYWIDYSLDRSSPHVLGGMMMPRRYVAEMIFDRVSAGRVYLGEAYKEDAPLHYYLRSKEKSWFIHDETKKQMEFLLRMWAEKGEDATVAYIRKVFLKGEGPGVEANGKRLLR